jgi:hypothetical protein
MSQRLRKYRTLRAKVLEWRAFDLCPAAIRKLKPLVSRNVLRFPLC